MKLGATIPVLRSFDEVKAKEFYLEFLEFKLDWEHRFEDGLPLYMQVSKDGCLLHITEHHGDCTPGSALRIKMQGLDEYQQLLLAKSYSHARPEIQEMPWGGRDMSMMDPFGNRLTFAEDTET